MTRFSAVRRSGIGFAAAGAGLIHLALATGAAPWLATGLVLVGAAELLWAILVISRPAVPLPRVAIAGALVPPAAWLLILLAGVADGPLPLPMIAATVLAVGLAIGITAGLRRPAGREPRHPAIGVGIAAVTVALITVPALLATEAPARISERPAPDHVGPGHSSATNASRPHR